MFIAGTDTSAATLIWTMSELSRNPMVMKRAEEEVRKIAQGKDKVEESDVSKLVYLKSVVKEALRLHPPAQLLLPRETTDDCEIRGYTIPTKTRVFVDAKQISHDPNSWENPLEFRPERFLDSPIDFRGQHFEFIPFGIGRRGCPGTNFAIQLVELALANLLHSFQWKLPPGVSAEDVDMEEALGLKKSPLFLVANPVRSNRGVDN
uniref:Uncharacterized protein MANES_14G058100 n=1 Tax=Rhizophora mucronata TaxID=61149 RepID=A0A2P2JDS3_RHIMU